MGLFDSIFGGKEKQDENINIEVSHPEMISLVGCLGSGIGEKFHKGKIEKHLGYLSESCVVGVLPPDTFPSYKSKLDSVTLGELKTRGLLKND